MSAVTTGYLVFIGGLLASLLIKILLTACETSLVKLRYSLGQMTELEALREHPSVNRLLDRSDRVSHILRLGNLASTLSTGLFFFSLLMVITGIYPGHEDSYLHGLISFVLTVILTYVLGQMLPRSLALKNPGETLRLTAFPVWLIVQFLTPFHRGLLWIGRRLFRLCGLNYQEDFNLLDVEVQIRALADEEGSISPELQKILRNTLRLRELEVSDVIVPRHQVQYFDLEDSLAENFEIARSTGHTRFPLCEGDLDNCIGIIHIKDLFRYRGDLNKIDLRRIRRNILSFNADDPLEVALKKMLSQKIHMALVLDEFGGSLGIITLEEILEELVGDIQDEFDTGEKQMVSPTPEGGFLVDGLTPIHDLEEIIGIEVENDEVSTVGGLITAELGRIPEPGERIELQNPPLILTIREVDEKRVISVLIEKVESPNSDEEEE